jgi:hypothetical protein
VENKCARWKKGSARLGSDRKRLRDEPRKRTPSVYARNAWRELRRLKTWVCVGAAQDEDWGQEVRLTRLA